MIQTEIETLKSIMQKFNNLLKTVYENANIKVILRQEH